LSYATRTTKCCTKAEAQKAKGNDALKAKDYKKAASHYTMAINLDPENQVYYSNRSAAYAELKEWSKALQDAQTCIEKKPEWHKGWSRRGFVFARLSMAKCALEDYTKACELENTASTQAAVEKAKANAEASSKTIEEEREWLMSAQKEEEKADMAKAGCVIA